MATAAEFHRVSSSGSATAAVVGENDPLTRRVAGVLSRHQYNVVYHPSTTALLRGLSSEPESAAGVVLEHRGARMYRMDAPREPESDPPGLYVLNFRGKQANGTELRAFVAALKTLNNRWPRTAILVAVDENAHTMIRVAINAGADEILSARDAQIDELVWTRVQSALAKAEAAAQVATAREHPTSGGPAGVEPRVAPRRRGRRGDTAAPASAPAAGDGASDVEEAWAPPASADEVRAAHDRVRSVLEHLPSLEERRGPLADVLGVRTPELRAGSGRLDAKKIASRLGVSLARLAKVTPISRQALNETPDSTHAQAALDPLARIVDVLNTVLPPEHVTAWLNAPHARLDGESPIHRILEGRGEEVARMLERARDGGVD